MIPNPTNDQWLKKIGRKASWKICRLMEVFQEKIQELIKAEGFGPTHEITKLTWHWKMIKSLGCEDEAELSIRCREAIHDALDERTEYLLSLTQVEVLSVLVAHITKVTEVLADQNSTLNTIVLAHKEDSLLKEYFYKIRPAVIDTFDSNRKLLSKDEKEKRNTIWISLMFRMLCWFLLHDFDNADVKMVPADLKGSRMPIFIG